MQKLTTMFVLKKIHRWLGFPIGLIFLITFGTGFLTSIDELLSRTAKLPQYSEPYQTPSLAQQAKAISHFETQHKDIRQIILPTPSKPYYEVAQRGESFFYHLSSLEEIGHVTKSREGFFQTVLQLHRNLLLGKEGFLGIKGAHYVAWVSLIALAISLLGIYIWWPLRRTFAWRDVLPQGTKRKNWYYSHMTAGIISAAVILMLALTGAAITYRDVAKTVLGVNDKEKSPTQHATTLDNNWHSWLSHAHQNWPNSQIAYIQFPRSAPAKGAANNKSKADAAKIKNNKNPKQNTNGNKSEGKQNQKTARTKGNSEAIVTLRLLTPQDWFGLPSSKVYINRKKSQVTGSDFFSELSFGEKLYSIIVPLHTGRNLSAIYVAVLMLLSIIGTVMVLSGVVSFLQKKRKWKTQKLNFRFNKTVQS